MMSLLSLFAHTVSTSKSYLLAVFISLCAFNADASQLSGQFNVTVNLKTLSNNPQISPNSAFCRSTNAPGSFGATVTIVCATGALVDISPSRTGMPWSPVNGGAYRYIFQASRDGDILGTIDSYVGVGSMTSWRVINLNNRDYLEMLVDW